MADAGQALLVQVEETDTDKSEAVVDSQTSSFFNVSWKWICCTFRVRLIGIIMLFILQIPILGYYYMSSDGFTARYMNTFQKNMHMDGIFGKKIQNENFSVLTFAGSPVISTVLKNVVQMQNHIPDSKLVITTPLAMTPAVITTTTSSPSDVSKNTLLLNTVARNLSDNTATKSKTLSTVIITTTEVTKPMTTTTEMTTPVTASDGSILPKCPPEPPNLQGRIEVSFTKPPKSFQDTQLDNPFVKKGGHGTPPLCVARHKVAIIIPYRDRVEHLQYFVQFMHPTLQRQQIDYQIFIINQAGHGKFNRAKLMNIGFLEASKQYPFQCFSFHDVDLILEDDRSLYWCSDRPRHLSAGVDKFNYVLPYGSIFGGVTLLSKEQMEKINGFSNEFWGWGGEDDDVYNRLAINGYKIIRYPINIARYKMIRHQREKGNEANPKRFEMIRKTKQTYKTDGLNSIKYKVLSIDYQPTYTNITVDVFGPS